MIKEKEYQQRRFEIGKKLKSHSCLILMSEPEKIRSNDTEYPYRQNSNFYYLSGLKEADATIVLVKKKRKITSYLFVQKKDPSLELWNGERVGKKRAKELYDFDAIFIDDDLEKKLQQFLKEKNNLYIDFGLEEHKKAKLFSMTQGFYAYINIAPLIGSARLIKSEAEIALIKKALSITKEAHHNAMRVAKKIEFEYELQAEIEYIFKKNGAYADAYTSIVACGNSANTLHYIKNDKRLVRGELILIDAGCEYEYYASDITRTIPVSGKFSAPQRELYSMILLAQESIIKMIQPDVLRSDLQKKSQELLTQGLLELGILQGNYKKLLKSEAYKKYYPHGIGHWMGIDVHDQCPYKTDMHEEIPLKEGMVLTIEPAIYVGKDDTNVPPRFRGIGIRIEDDILVTKNGFENLSIAIVKHIKDIENI